MSEIVKLIPATKDYIWGGHQLVEQYGCPDNSAHRVAESWVLSNHPDGSSKLQDGVSFAKYLAMHDKCLWGTNCERFENFPMMIKFIDANDALSVQVHPSDEYALANENSYGKTEYWYVLSASEDAYIYFGLAKDMTKEQLAQAVENGDLENCLNKVSVQAGDGFMIEAGTIHAIGKGVVIAEIQQCSNLTYRLYDYNRTDSNGNKRELHIDKALAVANLQAMPVLEDYQPALYEHEGYEQAKLVSCPYFTSTLFKVSKKCEHQITKQSFHSIVVIDGYGELINDKQTIVLKKGDSLFVPADDSSYTVIGKVSYIISEVE